MSTTISPLPTIQIKLSDALTVPSMFERRLIDAAWLLEKREWHDEPIKILQSLRKQYRYQNERLKRKFRLSCMIHVERHPLKTQMGALNLVQHFNLIRPTAGDLDVFERSVPLLQQVRFNAPAWLKARHDGDFCELLEIFEQASQVLSDGLFGVRSLVQNHLFLHQEFDKGLKVYRPEPWDETTFPHKDFAWTGQDLQGKSVLIEFKRHAAMGYGDVFNFAWFVERLEERGAIVYATLSPAVERVVRCSFPKLRIYQGGIILHHYITNQFNLLNHFKYGREWLTPPATPYLKAPQSSVDLSQIESGLNLPRRLRIGINWLSSDYSLLEEYQQRKFSLVGFRSIYLNELAPLLKLSSVTFFSLIKDEEQCQQAAEMGVIDLSGYLQDFGDTAAAISQLDLVITVDTAVAHLAGGLGAPTWLLLPKYPDWRWGLDGDRTGWYPSMRLFRQQNAGDWGVAIAEVYQKLNCLSAE